MKEKLIEELLENVSEIPLEYQELVLDKMKAMIVTKKKWFKKGKSHEPFNYKIGYGVTIC